jgi:serine/threonine protein kinase
LADDTFPVIPGYRILKQMGQGGMASVYLAVQESFGRQVALKIMSDQLGKDDVWANRFMHEARIVAQLSHSNIVPVFDVGSHEGRFYISMELLKGSGLEERMAKGLSVPEAIRIVCGVAAGLDYAGSKGFVHRDIKPDNIMFRDDGTPVILDFGIAKQKDGDSKMTKTGTIVGTTGYMSPEQAMGQELDERSDIYSLGVMLYELLTGYVPFRGETAVAVLLKHVQEPPPPLPANLNAFQPVIDKALAKKPQDRYRRASEMIEHLQELLLLYKQQNASPNSRTSISAPTANITPTDATVVMASVNTAGKTTVNPALQPTATPTSKANPTATPVVPKNNRKLLPLAIAVIVVLLILGGIAKRRHNAEQSGQPVPPASVPAPASTAATTPPASRSTTTETPPPSTSTAPEPAATPAEKTLALPVSTSEKKPSVEPTEVVKSARAPVEPARVEKQAPPAKVKAVGQVVDTPPAQPPKDTGDRQAVMRILSGANTCLENKQYDCAKSKAEAALDLDPDNEDAKSILATAKKAQQDAFSGNWDAK